MGMMDTLFDLKALESGGERAASAQTSQRLCTRRCREAHSRRKCSCPCGGANHGSVAARKGAAHKERQVEQMTLQLEACELAGSEQGGIKSLDTGR